MAREIHVGNIGTKFIATIKDSATAVDISGATTKDLIFKKPDGTSITRAGSFTTNGVDGQLEYATVTGDLDQSGLWWCQVDLVLATWEGRTERFAFRVYGNL